MWFTNADELILYTEMDGNTNTFKLEVSLTNLFILVNVLMENKDFYSFYYFQIGDTFLTNNPERVKELQDV